MSTEIILTDADRAVIKEFRQLKQLKVEADTAASAYESKKQEVLNIAERLMKLRKGTAIICNVSQASKNKQDAKQNYFKVSYAKRVRLEWDIEKLKKCIPRQEWPQAFITNISVVDARGFAEFFKSKGIKPSDVMPYLIMETTVNEKGVDSLSELGKIDEQLVRECCEVIETSVTLQLREQTK